MLKKIIRSLLLFTIILSLSSCANSYNSFESKFMEEYYTIIQNVDSKEVNDILEKLQSDENAKILDSMNQLLQDNTGLRESHQEKYDKLNGLYNGLIELKSAYGKWESYDLDKQDYLNTQLNYMYVYLSLLGYDKGHKEEK